MGKLTDDGMLPRTTSLGSRTSEDEVVVSGPREETREHAKRCNRKRTDQENLLFGTSDKGPVHEYADTWLRAETTRLTLSGD